MQHRPQRSRLLALSPATTRGERGAAALSLLTLGVVLALMMIMFMAIPLTRASDAKAKSNSAADAAALAGADFVKTELVALIESVGWLSGGWKALLSQIQLGGTAAAQYARLNDSQLIGYTFDVDTLTAHATVRGRTVDGEIFTSEAWARIQLPDCDVTDTPDDGDADLSHAPGGALLVTPAHYATLDDDDEDEDDADDTVSKTIKCIVNGDVVKDVIDIDPADLTGGLVGLPLSPGFLTSILSKTEPQLIR